MLLKIISFGKTQPNVLNSPSEGTSFSTVPGEIHQVEMVRQLYLPYEVSYVTKDNMGKYIDDENVPDKTAIIIAFLTMDPIPEPTGEYIYIDKDVDAYILSDSGKTITSLSRNWQSITGQ